MRNFVKTLVKTILAEIYTYFLKSRNKQRRDAKANIAAALFFLARTVLPNLKRVLRFNANFVYNFILLKSFIIIKISRSAAGSDAITTTVKMIKHFLGKCAWD